MIYSWSLFFFFWRLPSWLYYSTLGEIGVFYAYTVTADFLDSLIILFVSLALCLILPRKWFFDRFSTKAVSLSISTLAAIMFYNQFFRAASLTLLFQKLLAAGIVLLILLSILDEIRFVRAALEEIANRFTVFLYIFIPITAISLLVVLVRNLF